MRGKVALKYFKVLLLTGIIGLTGCEKIILERDPESKSEKVFDFLWNDLNNRYAYFELKGIDWISVRERYAHQVHWGMSEIELFDVLSEMLFELEDGHVNLTSTFNRSRNWEWSQKYPLDYNQGIIDRTYLGRDFWITGPLRNQVIDSVLYINYRSFNEVISEEHLRQVMERAQGLKGVIIDVRSNGGGNLDNANMLASGFTENAYVYARRRIKTGACAGCFSSWENLSVQPKSGLRFQGRVIVLVNRGSYSSTTYFAEMMRVNPNAKLIGNTTGGGGGTPAYGELPNGWMYRFSATQAVNNMGEHLEIGVPVDVPVELKSADENQGKDSILEFALDYLR
jgi:hypothetical protein